MLRFNDGIEFDTTGELRIEERFDGFYVVGEGWLIPVTGIEEGNETIKRLKSNASKNL
jgi:hypothetical protein